MIEFEEASFNHGASAVLRGLTLGLAPGAFHVLIGPSGAGKTTFLRLCYMDLAPSAGRMRWFGQTIAPNDRKAIAGLRRAIGVVPREPELLDHLTVLENVALPLTVGGVRAEDRAGDLKALLEWVDLAGRAEALPAVLSRSERQRVALARAVIMSPELILADEPAAVDWQGSLQLLALLVELNRMGKTMLVATHEPAVLRALDGEVEVRVLELADGRIAPVEMAS